MLIYTKVKLLVLIDVFVFPEKRFPAPNITHFFTEIE